MAEVAAIGPGPIMRRRWSTRRTAVLSPRSLASCALRRRIARRRCMRVAPSCPRCAAASAHVPSPSASGIAAVRSGFGSVFEGCGCRSVLAFCLPCLASFRASWVTREYFPCLAAFCLVGLLSHCPYGTVHLLRPLKVHRIATLLVSARTADFPASSALFLIDRVI
jgi:hypothetical protein